MRQHSWPEFSSSAECNQHSQKFHCFTGGRLQVIRAVQLLRPLDVRTSVKPRSYLDIQTRKPINFLVHCKQLQALLEYFSRYCLRPKLLPFVVSAIRGRRLFQCSRLRCRPHLRRRRQCPEVHLPRVLQAGWCRVHRWVDLRTDLNHSSLALALSFFSCIWNGSTWQ